MLNKTLLPAIMLLICWLPLHGNAELKVIEKQFDSIPHQLVQDTTLKVINVLEGGLDPVKEPELFVEKLSVVLDPVVAFEYIARGVLGTYANQVSSDQVKQFSSSFKQGLVNTYGKGMTTFGNIELAVLPPEAPLENQRRIAVVQEVRNGTSLNNVTYSMARNKAGEWKMINLVLNGVNLGLTFRGQFAAAVEKNDGDVTKTINEWGQVKQDKKIAETS